MTTTQTVLQGKDTANQGALYMSSLFQRGMSLKPGA